MTSTPHFKTSPHHTTPTPYKGCGVGIGSLHLPHLRTPHFARCGCLSLDRAGDGKSLGQRHVRENIATRKGSARDRLNDGSARQAKDTAAVVRGGKWGSGKGHGLDKNRANFNRLPEKVALTSAGRALQLRQRSLTRL